MTNSLLRSLGLSIVVLLCGCTSTAPVAEIRQFASAFAAVDTVSQPLLDDLAIAERTRGKLIAVRRAKGESTVGADECPSARVPWQLVDAQRGYVRGFCLPDAGYFTDIGDPPATLQLRRGLRVVARYAEVLAILAEGRNIDGAIAEVDALGSEVTGLLGFAGVADAPVGAALTALRPLLENAARQANTVEVKRLIIDGAPRVTELINALRTSAPPLFDALIDPSAQRLLALDEPAAVDSELIRIEAYRVALANYVTLLDGLQDAWQVTVRAAAAPPGRGNVTLLVARTAQLRNDAETARRVFAILRAGGRPVTSP